MKIFIRTLSIIIVLSEVAFWGLLILSLYTLSGSILKTLTPQKGREIPISSTRPAGIQESPTIVLPVINVGYLPLFFKITLGTTDSSQEAMVTVPAIDETNLVLPTGIVTGGKLEIKIEAKTLGERVAIGLKATLPEVK